jgi:choline dehydrogenase-like flavoprotein
MGHPFALVIGKLKESVYPYRIGFDTAESHRFCVSKQRDEMGAFKIEFQNNGGPTPLGIASLSGNWGAALEEEIRESFGRMATISAMLEQLPDEKNSVSLDPLVRDYFGNPAPRITYATKNYEKETAKRAEGIMEKIFDALKATGVIALDFIGLASGHHMGTCRMGVDPRTSVVDRHLRTHDIDNLFIVGSSTFVTGGAVNPSLTIAALAIRTAEYILKEAR